MSIRSAVATLKSPGDAVAVMGVSDEEYFSDRYAITRSTLNLLPTNPGAVFRWAYDTQAQPLKNTPAKRLGTLVHLAALQPDEFQRRVFCGKTKKPKGASRKGNKDQRAAFDIWRTYNENRERHLACQPDRIDIDIHQELKVRAMASQIRGHNEGRALIPERPQPEAFSRDGLKRGYLEMVVVWKEETTGVICKVKFDAVRLLEFGDVVGTELETGISVSDIKTTNSLRTFSRSAKKYGYDVQAAMYTGAAQALFKRPVNFYTIAVESVEPDFYVEALMYCSKSIAAATKRYQILLQEFKDRCESGNWNPPRSRGVHTVSTVR